MKLKGLKDMQTNQGLHNRATPATRVQAVTILVRLEHEKAHLEREAGVWASNHKRAEAKLRKVEEGIATLQEALYAPPDGGSEAPGEDAGGAQSEGQRWRKVLLEY